MIELFCKYTCPKQHNSQTNLRVANRIILQLHKIDIAFLINSVNDNVGSDIFLLLQVWP